MSLTPFSPSEIPIVGEPEEDYASKAQAFAYGIQRLANEYNAEAALENAATTTTSVSSQSLTTGSKTFVVAAGLGWAAGMAGRAANTSSPLNYANFTCTSYSGTSLVVNFDSIVGSGAGITTWTIHKSSNAANAALLSSNTFTGAQNFAQGADIASSATVNLDTATGNTDRVTGNTGINAWTLSNGRERTVIVTGTPLLTYSATTNKLNTGGRNYQCVGGEVLNITADGGVVRVVITNPKGECAVPMYVIAPDNRQTVLSAPIDANGNTALGGTTGGTSVTTTGTLVLSAAGGLFNRVGEVINPVFSGLATNGTMYLFCEIDAAGVVTTGTSALAPTYRRGGADVVTNGQWTFNGSEWVGKVGNGTTATQVYRVYVGQVTVAGGVVTAITWYQIQQGFAGTQKAEIRLETCNGFGSTDTFIPTFATVGKNISNGKFTLTQNATNGTFITINHAGMYGFSFVHNMVTGGGSSFGVTVNSAINNASVLTLPLSNIAVLATTSNAGYLANCSSARYLQAGDIVRPHANGAASGTQQIFCFWEI